jgi:hypothetical protein
MVLTVAVPVMVMVTWMLDHRVWDFDAIDKEHGRMLQIALNEIAERDQQLLQSSAELEAKDTKLGRAR